MAVSFSPRPSTLESLLAAASARTRKIVLTSEGIPGVVAADLGEAYRQRQLG